MQGLPTIRILRGGPDPIQRDSSATLSIEVGDVTTGERPTITTAGSSFALYDRNGVALITGGAVTTPSKGIAAYAMSAASVPDTLALGEGYREVWTLVIDGTAYTVERDAALCRLVPTLSLVAEDLYTIDPSLDGAWPQRQADTHWRPQLDEAARVIHQRLWEMRRRPWLVWSKGSPRQCALHYALALCYGTAETRLGDSRWGQERARHMEAYEREWERLTFDYEVEQTSTRGEQMAPPVLIGSAGPGWGFGAGW